MTAGLIAPAAQICAFALGCALIHAARAHAAVMTRALVAGAVGLAVLVLLVGSLACAPEDADAFDAVMVYAALG